MKKLVLLVLVATGFIAKSQAYYKNALIFDANAGLEIYNTSYSFQSKDINNNKFDSTKTDKAGNRNFTFGLEYGLHKHLGVGARVKLNNYFTGNDSIKPTVKSNDFMVFVNYHPLKILPKFDLVLGGELGYSGLNYNTNNKENVILTGTGLYGSIYINPRVYIKRFGFNLKLYLPYVNYNNLTTNNPDINNYYTITRWKGDPSWGASIGIQYRFLKILSKAVTAATSVTP
ncbi:MAG: hypothetical protein SFY56_07315 [Bacteroidota bacterium]|nr:hypothetical protein [Bacteroidota bacterium]